MAVTLAKKQDAWAEAWRKGIILGFCASLRHCSALGDDETKERTKEGREGNCATLSSVPRLEPKLCPNARYLHSRFQLLKSRVHVGRKRVKVLAKLLTLFDCQFRVITLTARQTRGNDSSVPDTLPMPIFIQTMGWRWCDSYVIGSLRCLRITLQNINAAIYKIYGKIRSIKIGSVHWTL